MSHFCPIHAAILTNSLTHFIGLRTISTTRMPRLSAVSDTSETPETSYDLSQMRHALGSGGSKKDQTPCSPSISLSLLYHKPKTKNCFPKPKTASKTKNLSRPTPSTMTMTTLPTVTASTSSAMPPKPVQPFTSKIPRYTSRATTVAPLSPSRVVRTTPVDSLSLAPPNKRQIPKAKGLVRPTPRPPVPPKNSSGIPCSGNRVRWLPEMISTPVHYKGPIKGIIKVSTTSLVS